MQRKIYLVNMVAVLLIVISTLAGCSESEDSTGNVTINTPNIYNAHKHSDYDEDININYGNMLLSSSADNEIKSASMVSISTKGLSSERLAVLRENLFFGLGVGEVTVEGGGDELMWYPFVFDAWRFGSGVHGFIVDYVGFDEFSSWVDQTSAQRDFREPGLLQMIEHFNLTLQDLINAHEIVFQMPMAEADVVIERARIIRAAITPMTGNEIWEARTVGHLYINELGAVTFDEIDRIGSWEGHFTSSDIAAMFSGCVNTLWAAFPGYGVLQNNRAYSPEWILNNTERALYGELIPLGEVERLIDRANFHLVLEEITDAADTILQTAEAALNSPIPIPFTLSFDLNVEQEGIVFTSITPNSIGPTTINAWEGIVETLTDNHAGFPANGPTMVGYEFIGWYLDDGFTIPLTETFRMPARNVTLYARWQPSAPALLTQQNRLSAGTFHSTALMHDNSLWAWGSNGFGLLGDGTATNRHQPVPILDDVISVSAGQQHTLAIRDDGSLWGWGFNSHGQLGGNRDTQTIIASPVWIMDDVIEVAAGGGHTMVIKSDNSLWAFGDNWHGQLGDGTDIRRTSPVWIMDDVVAVSAGNGYTMAIRSDGSLWGWGINSNGVLGDGTNQTRLSPVWIMDDVIAVSAGSMLTMAIKSDGSLWGWGPGPIGDGTNQTRLSPVWIMDDVVAVSAGGQHAVAIKSDGSLWAWGINMFFGALGDGTGSVRFSPIWIMDDVVAASAGNQFTTMAVRTDGSLWAWGRNDVGQVGDGTAIHRPTPTLINEGGTLPPLLTAPMQDRFIDDFSVHDFIGDMPTIYYVQIYGDEPLVLPKDLGDFNFRVEIETVQIN